MENDINTIPLETAQAWARKWRETSELKGFWIPKEDLMQMHRHQGDVDVRAYLGIDEKGEPKLMLVGVKDNVDMIDEAKELYIYDFSKPCPTMCDLKSGLFRV